MSWGLMLEWLKLVELELMSQLNYSLLFGVLEEAQDRWYQPKPGYE